MGDAFIGQNNDSTRTKKKTIQPLEVGHATSPQRAEKGGLYVAFAPIYGPAWNVSNNLCNMIFEVFRLKSC